ncbi:GH92 family glycosyl hydrolase [Sphingomonas sp. PR090111-T3T-6A]|uniref:GH92 family glycosyl hydrolase n=1 Tax=Sphingomonas sp. PR090111-T3T-6A TaxID=685778 RepID=UPI000399A0F6|nr:GH92 family glycosyl hydrolase [Sphingomonas sp. PR090111-T3T-6A]
MRRLWRAVLGVAMLPIAPALAASSQPVDWVNPLIGTGGTVIGPDYAGTMPLVTTPFGMTNWTAQTRQNRISVTSYAYEDQWITGFIGTHQPAVWMGDYGYVTLMPEMGGLQPSPEYRRLRFSHADETATPYYYAVTMADEAGRKLRAEMTSTDHASYLRFTFPAGVPQSVLVEATRAGTRGWAKYDAERGEILGYNPDRMDAHLSNVKLPDFKGYFVVRFRRKPSGGGVYQGPLGAAGTEVEGDNVGAFARFDGSDTVVEAQVGTSFISLDQARANFDAEMPRWDFDGTKEALKQVWNGKLGTITVEGATDDQKHILYTGLYHALLYPKLMSEQGRYHSAFDDKVHQGTSYTAFSIWDTFRAENSLLTLIAPERIDGMVGALLQDYREGGYMPKWPNPSYTNIMIGTHADSLVAEAMVKGFKGFDRKLAYEAVLKDATVPPEGDTTRRWLDREPGVPYEARAGLTWSSKIGYVPADKVSESASSTLEEAYDDFAVAQVAREVGDQAGYRRFLDRSLRYRVLFNPATGFMQARNLDGSWASPAEGWTEGDQWAYLFAALHDIPGTIALLGGDAAFNARLDAHFAGGHNHHDNEPSHHYSYLYDFGGEPWKAQATVRHIAETAYSNTPAGMLGNEDCGQMSAWYIFAALGFYPVNPVSKAYMIGSPLYARATLNLPGGKSFSVEAPGNGPANVYIQSATLNGRPLDKPFVTYEQIVAGGKLRFVMGPKPSGWASQWRGKPDQ